MKFEFLKTVDGEVPAYEGKTVKTGDIVEFSERFAEKALKNPDYKLMGATTEPKPKRKYTRKVNRGDEG